MLWIDSRAAAKLSLYLALLVAFHKANACESDIEFMCETSGLCLPVDWRCDGQYDCLDESDERNCDGYYRSCDEETEFRCSRTSCIPKGWQCDGEEDCVDGTDEDTATCSDLSCDSTQFQCGSSKSCISSAWQCDGTEDCEDGSDETNCTKKMCQENEFQCLKSTKCIPSRWTCDGDNDCDDESDEHDSVCKDQTPNCPGNERSCGNRQCIPAIWWCDTEEDCIDGSDEANCDATTEVPTDQTEEVITCSESQFQCLRTPPTLCIPMQWVCDGVAECSDNSDEDPARCNAETTESPCSGELMFACNSGMCVLKAFVCDDSEDCDDGSDEVGCDVEPVNPCGDRQFNCQSEGKCIPSAWVCDADRDCSDGSDEDYCEEASCQENEFRCKSNECIRKQFVCDGDPDCRDQSDEETELCRTDVPAVVLPICPTDPSKFVCGSGGLCIFKAWLCDSEGDCSDGSDEENCGSEVSCAVGEFHCSSNHICIPEESLCDSRLDCIDGQDEMECPSGWTSTPPPQTTTCPSASEVMCGSGECIFRAWLCDRENDCEDGSDEQNCDGTYCNMATEFQCQNGQCIPVSWKCDNDPDCLDESDEGTSVCQDQTCSDDEFTCDDGSCKPFSVRCNGVQDCFGNSDEKDCSGVCPAPDRFRCPNNSSCILTSQLCDGIDDCQGGVDETECTIQACSDDNGGCGSRQCIDVPKGYYCKCGAEYQITENGCEDIDECAQSADSLCPGIICTNRDPGYICECPHIMSYNVDLDNRTCVFSNPLPPTLLLADRTAIRKLNGFNQTVELFADGIPAVAITYDPSEHAAYVSDVAAGNIYRIRLSDGSDDTQQVIINDTLTSDGLAIDSIYGNLYWTDTGDDTINVARWDGSFKKTLINENLEEPRGIVVDPLEGYMFWTDWGSTPHIGRAGLDGQDAVTIVTEGIEWPNGIALDYDEQRIFWADARLRRLESSDINGNNRHVIRDTDIGHPFGIVVHQANVYWTDWDTSAVLTANKYNGERMEVVSDGFGNPMGLASMDHRFMDLTNFCESAGNPCSHLCLRSLSNQQGFLCACPTGTTLASDGETCLCEDGGWLMEDGVSCDDTNECLSTPSPCPAGIGCIDSKEGVRCICPNNYYLVEEHTGPTCLFSFPTPPPLLLADGQRALFIDTLLGSVRGGVQRLIHATAVAYDDQPGNEGIYLSDTGSNIIKRVQFISNTEGNTITIKAHNGAVFGIAFDSIHRYLYWGDARKNIIGISTWNGSYTATLLTRQDGIGTPRSIAVDPQNGYLFWTEYGARVDYPKIKRAGLDGSNMTEIVSTDLQRPTSLTYDASLESIYWVDAGSQTIETSKSDGSERRVLMTEMSRRPSGIAVYQDTVYWTDISKTSLFSANKFTGSRIDVVIKNLLRPMGLAVAIPDETNAPNACEEAGNICSHFCLGVPRSVDPAGFRCFCPGDNIRLTGSNNSICVCQNGSPLLPDGVSCQPRRECHRRQFQCQTSGECILLNQACDGHQDCDDGSDEDNCDGGCGDWGYQCNNGRCIPKSQQCDGIPGDCPEYDDEIVCENVPDWCGTTQPDPCPGVQCLSLLAGLQCICPDNYVLLPDNRTCRHAFPTPPKLLVAAQLKVLEVDTSRLQFDDVQGRWNDVVGITYGGEDAMFVGDIALDTIDRYFTSGGNVGQTLLATDRTVISGIANTSEGLAYDWVSKNLYWVNTEQPASIDVVSNNGQFPSTKILKNLDKPRDLAVDPKEGYLYWTDWGDNAMIGKAGLDGSQPLKLVYTNIGWPNGLTLDFQARRVYWVDSKLDRMEYAGFDGDGRRILIQNNPKVQHPFGIALHQHMVFWGDWNSKEVTIANKFTGEILDSIQLDTRPLFMSAIEHRSEFGVIPNRCLNSTCSHICLPSPSKLTDYICACPQGSLLDWTKRTCLCENGGRLLEDGVSCEDPKPLPLQVSGLTTRFLAKQGVGNDFDLQCTITQNAVECIPKGIEENPSPTQEGTYQCQVP
ncbi:low-density lipoprotein receptor-related protein 1-like [Asterias rubens]|uniref:low-density lipoprotein receptor-related protein 1-like n=1 Tax=Asterias rubens TaxID=7604 RepID=UPI0014553110|nr:low-density lipoprotein receptor-related protein 1-like [Asterias rubens]